ncbi:tyrosine-type recombinase/integrase [Arthrobacter sp. NPDC092385]|uniref:tyrosine-type recombinase/integrase n=1 Tax=Arthrobacter sp. NPDC092385 TaxID=3363943 RepID=UPI00381CC68A
MGSIHAYENKGGKWYRVLYKKPDNSQGQNRGFKLKRDAQAYLDAVEVSKRQGQYVAPSDGRTTVGTLGADWLAAHKQTVKPSTFHSDSSAWRIHVEPMWGGRAVSSLRRTEITAWAAKLSESRSPTTVVRCLGVLSGVLHDAAEDKRIAVNPALGIKVARKTRSPRAYLTHHQVEALAAESKHPDLVRFLAYTGLRWGEATGLRVGHIDRRARRAVIIENAVSVNGRIVVGTPKMHESRSVVYPAFLSAAVEEAFAGKTPEMLLWGEGVKHLRPGNAVSGWFGGARKRAQAKDPAFPMPDTS